MVNDKGVPSAYVEETFTNLRNLTRYFKYIEYDYLNKMQEHRRTWTQNFKNFFGKETVQEALAECRSYPLTDISEDEEVTDAIKLALVSIQRTYTEDIEVPFPVLENELEIHTQTSLTPRLTPVVIMSDKLGVTAPARAPNLTMDPVLEGRRRRPRLPSPPGPPGPHGPHEPHGPQQQNSLGDPK